MEFKITTDDKPHLDALLKSDKKKGMEILSTFVELMEESVAEGWADLPKKFSPELTFKALIKGILHGSLDLRGINPDTFDALKEEVHPLSMLAPRKNWLDGGMRYANWRGHFRLPDDAEINQETIQTIFRRLLRYYRYVDVQALAHALINKQVKTFEGLGERNVQMLPFLPALRYQQAHFGDLHVGKFFDEIGVLDCGTLPEPEDDTCPACKTGELKEVSASQCVCLSCNAGFWFKEVDDIR